LCPQFDSGSCHHKFKGAEIAPFYFMNYQLNNLIIPVQNEQNVPHLICSTLKIEPDKILKWTIIRRALDTRKSNAPQYVYTVEVEIDSLTLNHPDLTPFQVPKPESTVKTKLSDVHPVIVGTGPAGLFCALAMTENGLKPILYERGDCIEDRAEAVSKFWQAGILDAESNVQFGEGGAGAFSDGKLTSRSGNHATQKVYDLLIRFGAPESIKWEALPHLGTDVIRQLVIRIRQYLISKGCRFYYRSVLSDIHLSHSIVDTIKINAETVETEALILAIGNASRDTFRMLNSRGVWLEPKSFAVGFRIAHPQDWINRAIYGNDKWVETLGAASYRLTSARAGKGTYTFCMCPGGFIIAAASEKNATVTNGMSFADRNHPYGNSAIVTQIDSHDYGTDLWSGMQFQAEIEQKAFISKYAAPTQQAGDFLTRELSTEIKHSYLFPTSQPYPISDLYPVQITQALADGLKRFDQIYRGFIQSGMLIAPETRTSSPLRMVRDKLNFNCLQISNLYAVGEGSGYAGGIISSAADGYKTGSKFYI
jgi:uncharacterized FAD-dependent dehydrogenase